jgi:ATP-dependent helicase/DNAse subunit B
VLATSYSQIDLFLQCPHRWYQSYLKGYRGQVKGEAVDLGSAVHKTLEEYYLDVKDGRIWEFSEAKELFDDNIEGQDVQFASDESKELAMSQHYDMLAGLTRKDSELTVALKDCEVLECEKEFQYRFPLDFDIAFNGEIYNEIYIIGSIDMIARNQDGGIIAIDFKSGKKVFKNDKMKSNLQLPIYSLVIKDLYGELPVETFYYFTRLDTVQSKPVIKSSANECEIVRFKTGKRAGQIKDKEKCVGDINDELMNIFKRQYATGPEVYTPNSTPLCSWCEYSKLYGSSEHYICNDSMVYERSDVPIPDGREYLVKGNNNVKFKGNNFRSN